MSRLTDPDHYQHTTAPIGPHPPATRPQPPAFEPGDRVTVIPDQPDHYLLWVHRQAIVASEEREGGYLVELPGAPPGSTIHGPVPGRRLIPGWAAPWP